MKYRLRDIPREYRRPYVFSIILVVSAILLIALQAHVHNSRGLMPEDEARWFELATHALITTAVVSILHLLDQFGLWREVFRKNESTLDDLIKKQNHLMGASDKCGIKDIYVSRREAQEHVDEAIDRANNRIWLLGVGLNVSLGLESIVPKLRMKKRVGNVDVRILMLDPIRSTAVFRTFLESVPGIAKRIVEVYDEGKHDWQDDDLYFRQRLFRHLNSTCDSLYGIKELENSIRFYAHTPACWMVIADHTAFFQPYTFGSLPKAAQDSATNDSPHTTRKPDEETIGDLLPVFRFEDKSASQPFRILLDHFKKLWATSDTDLFHIRARYKFRESLVADIFRTRGAWLRQVAALLDDDNHRRPLEKSPGTENYRDHTRQACPSNFEVSFRLAGNKNSPKFSAKLLDFSRGGIAIESRDGSQLKVETRVHFETEGVALPELGEFFKQTLLSPGNLYQVRSVNNGRIGLQNLSNGASPPGGPGGEQSARSAPTAAAEFH
jgi:hypothetical protein